MWCKATCTFPFKLLKFVVYQSGLDMMAALCPFGKIYYQIFKLLEMVSGSEASQSRYKKGAVGSTFLSISTLSTIHLSMSANENSNPDVATTVGVGQKRPGALQLGPRKKPYVIRRAAYG